MSKPNSAKSWIKENKLLAGLILFLGLWIFISFMSTDDTQRVVQSSFSGSDTAEVSEDDDSVIVALNEAADLGTYSFTVLSFEETDIISSSYGQPSQAKDGAKFIVVELEVVNQGSKNFNFFPDNTLRLYDHAGREFETYEDTIGSIDNYLNVRDIGPGIKETGVVVYEVPESNESHILIGKNMSTDTLYLVSLQ